MEKWKRNLGIVAMSIMTILLLLIIFVLLNGKQTYTSEGNKESQSVSSLICATGNQENSFFHTKIANTANNEIKATYKEDKLDRLFYTYKGVYRSKEVAHEDEVDFLIKYDVYMGQNNLPQGSLNPSHSAYGTKFNLSLYIDDYNQTINNATAQFFFIDEDKIKDFSTYSMKDMKKYYESKSFECQVIE